MAKPIMPPPTAPYTFEKKRTTISDIEIAQAAYNAGFRDNALVTAVAVAIGEAHGNTTAVNDRGEFSVGLWQINVNGYLVKRLKKYGFTSWQELWDPDKNAIAAYRISSGGKNFRAWSIYKHNAHLKFMDRAQVAANTVTRKTPTPPDDPAPVRKSNSTYYPITSPNILPIAPTKVSDPLLPILIIGVIGVIVIGLILLMRKRGA